MTLILILFFCDIFWISYESIWSTIFSLYRTTIETINFWTAKKLEELDREKSNDKEDLKFHSLSPINNADVIEYVKALNWALENAKKECIYNIALTGPYGSGKSSILKTFQEQNSNKDFVFLEISLATFKEELTENGEADAEEGEDKKMSTKKNDILRLIEFSILQQIFYHEEDSKIPDSRFKKIRSFKRKHLLWITSGVMSAILFGSYLFFPKKVELLLKTELKGTWALSIHWFSLVVFLIALSIIIYRSIRLFYGFKISKFKFQDAEIEIDKNISKSILNNHLDEILYFFEVTPYSVVIIEDLDRFRQSEIFTKLRELNLLINKSKKVKKDVVSFMQLGMRCFGTKTEQNSLISLFQ